ncbi:hypothetical protein Droror1_Dr00016407, partial [Drosera rotundifolia]
SLLQMSGADINVTQHEHLAQHVGHLGGALSKNLFLKDKKNKFYIVIKDLNLQLPSSPDLAGDVTKHYKGGVFMGPCRTSLNHLVTAVGYGVARDGTLSGDSKCLNDDVNAKDGAQSEEKEISDEKMGESLPSSSNHEQHLEKKHDEKDGVLVSQ